MSNSSKHLRALAAALFVVGLSALAGAAAAAADPVPPTSHESIRADAAPGTPVFPSAQATPAPVGAEVGPAAPQPQAPASAHRGFDWGRAALEGLLSLLALILFAVSITTLSWMLHAWRSPKHLSRTRFDKRGPAVGPRLSFSLLVPARHEEAVLGQTLDILAASHHDRVEVIAIIGHDDESTRVVAEAAADRNPGRVRVVIDHSVPKNKPRALNTALAQATGEVVGVFDAEDDVHPDLLRQVDARMVETGADVLQGGVQLMNVHTSWWSLRNCLEYYFWFRSRLHFHADQAFIPLGGNTVFTRRELLVANGGWDPDCLAEDCEIGVRLSSQGARVAVVYEPEVVTREETPDSVSALIKQRTRWNQGFIQVLRKGVWRQLPGRRQRLLARYTLAMPFLQALTGALVPVSLALIFFVRVPTLVVLLTLLPIAPTIMTIAMEVAAYGEFCRLYRIRARTRDVVYLVVGAIPYQLILAYAAGRAVVRQLRGQGGWEKTAHANLHRVARPSDLVSTSREAA